ncbi:unnamed protein product [Vitrella brassicaformis CCMP3155]|uniref:Uncharacterized protein n=1 Tax=Vitrella brassicaformis (strain CCMP3155) TaxID=1169540 RepID=A0A0G4GF86_VITBC|nr:unnamed protein product [Vitrella brassicaformis CCMP3155]|eukprot:CEM28157.1 unnamed protein product [Vitrella brassicaformis CCMP3155]
MMVSSRACLAAAATCLAVSLVVCDGALPLAQRLLSPSTSNHPLYRLDYQDVRQASEPVPVRIAYTVPKYGAKDLDKALKQASDTSVLLAERMRERRREDNDCGYRLLHSLREINHAMARIRQAAAAKVYGADDGEAEGNFIATPEAIVSDAYRRQLTGLP